jgi:hypothetical protein
MSPTEEPQDRFGILGLFAGFNYKPIQVIVV